MSPSSLTSSPSLTCVPSCAGLPLIVTRPSAMSSSASRREQAPLSLRYLLSRTARTYLRVRYLAGICVAPAPRHAADDPAQHAVSRDGVLDGLLAPARRASRSRGR